MNTKKEYIAPTLTTVSFIVEQGFVGSSQLRLFQNFQLFQQDYNANYNDQSHENWNEEGSAFGSGW